MTYGDAFAATELLDFVNIAFHVLSFYYCNVSRDACSVLPRSSDDRRLRVIEYHWGASPTTFAISGA